MSAEFRMSKPKWKTSILDDIIEELIDYRGKTPTKTDKGIPLITAKIVKDGAIQAYTEFIAEKDYVNWMTRGYPRAGDVVLTTEAPLGEVAQITDSKIALAQRIVTLRGKQGILSNEYLKYFLISEVGQSRLRERETGTTVTGIKQSELRQVQIDYPDFRKQTRIAAILSSLDHKIELNRQTNATLEGIAQALFKEWFIDFRYPGATGKMQDSELGPIPNGWRVGKVGEVCRLNKNTISKKDVFEHIDYIEISEVNRGKIGNTSVYLWGTEPSRAKRKLNHGDIILSTVRPDRGAYFLAHHPPAHLIASTGFAVFSPTTVPSSFLYLLLTDAEKLEYYGHVADGGAYPAINPNLIMDIDIIIPDEVALTAFQLVAGNLFEELYCNNQQSEELAKIRDHILPRLLSGDIEV